MCVCVCEGVYVCFGCVLCVFHREEADGGEAAGARPAVEVVIKEGERRDGEDEGSYVINYKQF